MRSYPKSNKSLIAVLLGYTVLFYSIVFPVVHEGGHCAAAQILGVQVQGVVWTMWTGHPRVFVARPSRYAIPWLSVGAIVATTFFGTLFMLLWIAADKRLHWIPSLLLAQTAILLLAGNFLTIPELSSSLEFGHIRPLARHFGFSGVALVGFELLPSIVAVALIAVIAVRLKARRREIDRLASRSSLERPERLSEV